MEEKKELISRYLEGRGLNENCLKRRQLEDLEIIYDAAVEMRRIVQVNELTVKNVSVRTHKKSTGGRSISLATYYNNGKLLYGFVEFLKSASEKDQAPELIEEIQAELKQVKEINSALIRRDIKFEEMQAEIDALRTELQIAQQYQSVKSKEASMPHSGIPDIGIIGMGSTDTKS